MKIAPSFMLGSLLATTAPAAVISHTFISGTPVPDNNPIGLADTRTLATGLDTLLHLTVTLELTQGWNGDLYAYLQHGPGFTVLLNRIGRTAQYLLGSGTSGMNVTFSADAIQDIHLGLPTAGLLSGVFQPDGRTADPDLVLDSSPRAEGFSLFTGLSPDGDWTLFIADMAAGETSTLRSWTLEITAVPEPSTAWLMTALGRGFIRRRRLERRLPCRR